MQQLPSKSDNIMRVAMAFEQQDLYDELKARFVVDVKKDRDSSVRGQSGASMMMQLRKAANHHLLHRRIYDDARLRQMAQRMLQVCADLFSVYDLLRYCYLLCFIMLLWFIVLLIC